MQIANLPRIFKTDIKIKTTRGYYYRHFIDCGKRDCKKCHIYEQGHPYFYFYPLDNDRDQVFYLKKDYYSRIHIWGKVISRTPSDIQSQREFRIHNKEGKGKRHPLEKIVKDSLNMYERDKIQKIGG